MAKNERPAVADRAPEADDYITSGAGDFALHSRSVSWWPVHEFVERMTATVPGWPMAGSPAWCALADDDPRKLAAVLDAGQHHALRVETAQEERAAASQSVAAGADWPAIAQEILQRRAFCVSRPWAKRVAR